MAETIFRLDVNYCSLEKIREEVERKLLMRLMYDEGFGSITIAQGKDLANFIGGEIVQSILAQKKHFKDPQS